MLLLMKGVMTMAYNKINWENGSIYKEGYVLIDGVKHNTVQPEYSGETPINADNLNHMDDGIEVANRKDVMTAYLTSNIVISTGGAYVDLPLNSNISTGTELTFSNGGIVIGSGITKVIISAQISLPNTVATGGKNIVIRKNGNIVARNWLSISTAGNNGLVLTAKLIDVQEGDVLKLGYYGSANDGIQGGAYTHLTVEAVEYE